MDALQKINELRRALNDFREHADALKQSFADVQKVFDANSFASPETFGNFNRDFASWTDESDKCRRLWAEIFDMPLPKTPAEIETALLAEERRLVAESVFGRAEKFLSFASTDARLESILASHRHNLETLLTKKTRDAKTKEPVELYAKFVDAFNEPNFGKKFAAGKELSEFFGDEFIGAGLFGNALPREIYIRLRALADKRKVSVTGHTFLAESFFAGFKVAGKFDLFVAGFWTATDEAEKFLRELTDYINGRKIDRVIVAGLDMSHAAKVFDALDEALTLPEAEQFTFAFDEDAFCRRGTTEKFPFAEILPSVDEPSRTRSPTT